MGLCGPSKSARKQFAEEMEAEKQQSKAQTLVSSYVSMLEPPTGGKMPPRMTIQDLRASVDRYRGDLPCVPSEPYNASSLQPC